MYILLNLIDLISQELSNDYLFAKIGFDAAETGPLKVRQKLAKSSKKVRKNIG